MNATTIEERQVMDLAPTERSSQSLARQQISGEIIAAHSPMGMMMAAMNQGASLEQVEKMMDLQD